MSGWQAQTIDAAWRRMNAVANRPGVLVGLIAVWTFLLGCTPMQSMDVWWHLRTGQWIVSEFRVPQTDLYTFTVWDRPWIDLHWGFQILAWMLYRIGSTPLLVLTKAICMTLTVLIGIDAARCAGIAAKADFSEKNAAGDVEPSSQPIPEWLLVLCWLPAVICISGRGIVRPEMLSMLFLAISLRLCVSLDRRVASIYWFPLLMLVWVNCHALFVLGVIVLVAKVVDLLVRRQANGRWGLPHVRVCESRTLFYGSLASVAACFANPYFEEGALFPLVLFRKFSTEQAFYSQRIGEFIPPAVFFQRYQFSNLYLNMEILLFTLTLASMIALLLKKQMRPFRWLLFAGFSFLAWKASRNTAPFALVSGWVLSANVGDLLLRKSQSTVASTQQHARGSAERFTRNKRKQRRQQPALPRRFPATAMGVFGPTVIASLMLVLTGSIFTGHWARWGGENRRLGLGEMDGWYMHGAAEMAGRAGMPMRAFVSHIGQAAVYLFHNGPQRRVFMDGRLEVADQPTFVEFETIGKMMQNGDRRWMDLLRDGEGNLPAVLLDSRTARSEIRGLGALPDWRLVYAEPAGALFIPTSLAETLGLPQADVTPLIAPPGTRVVQPFGGP